MIKGNRYFQVGDGKKTPYSILLLYFTGIFFFNSWTPVIFLYAFAKSDKDTISEREEVALSIVADSFVSSSEEHVAELLDANLIWEVSSYE